MLMIIKGTWFLLTGVLFWLIAAIYGYFRKKPLNKILFRAALGSYMVILIFCIWFPMYIRPGGARFGHELIQAVPFFTVIKSLSSCNIANIGREIFANILMTVPYGVMVPFLFRSKKRWKYVLNMFGLPLAIEFSQFLWCISLNSHYRTADIDDVLLNALGILIGYVIYRYLPDRIKKFFKF